MELSLIGKRALVCGASKGIGKASATELAALGASVTLVARDEASLRQAMKELTTTSSQKHTVLVADFSEPAKLKEKLEQHFEKGVSPVDILVNNTGGPPGGNIVEAQVEEFERAFSQHILASHVITTWVLAGMKLRQCGRIINIISTSVKAPLAGLGVSNTIRGAMANWSKTLANEVACFNITVNNILPGTTDTERLHALIEAKAKKSGKTFEAVRTEMIQAVPAGRFAQPHEIANAVAFLASPAAAYINGTNITVDGGRSLSL